MESVETVSHQHATVVNGTEQNDEDLSNCLIRVLVIAGQTYSQDQFKYVLNIINSSLERVGKAVSGDRKQDMMNAVRAHRFEQLDLDQEYRVSCGDDGVSFEFELLVNPSLQTLDSALKSFFKESENKKQRGFLINATLDPNLNGDLNLKDSCFTYDDFSLHVHQLVKAKSADQLLVHVYLAPRFIEANKSWKLLEKLNVFKVHSVVLKETLDGQFGDFVHLIQRYFNQRQVADLLDTPRLTGTLKATRPCLYIFPSGNGDSAYFNVDGYSMLVNGGYERHRPSFWKFVSQFKQVDSVLITHADSDSLGGLSSFFSKKLATSQSCETPDDAESIVSNGNTPAVYSVLGNLIRSPITLAAKSVESRTDSDIILDAVDKLNINLVSLVKSTDNLLLNAALAKQTHNLNKYEHHNLFNKIGYGSLDLFVLTPLRSSVEFKEFCAHQQANFSRTQNLKQVYKSLPSSHLATSVCLLVWLPAGKNATALRLLFTGNVPQNLLNHALDKLKDFELLSTPTYRVKHQSQEVPELHAIIKEAPVKKTTESTPAAQKEQTKVTKVEKPVAKASEANGNATKPPIASKTTSTTKLKSSTSTSNTQALATKSESNDKAAKPKGPVSTHDTSFSKSKKTGDEDHDSKAKPAATSRTSVSASSSSTSQTARTSLSGTTKSTTTTTSTTTKTQSTTKAPAAKPAPKPEPKEASKTAKPQVGAKSSIAAKKEAAAAKPPTEKPVEKKKALTLTVETKSVEPTKTESVPETTEAEVKVEPTVQTEIASVDQVELIQHEVETVAKEEHNVPVDSLVEIEPVVQTNGHETSNLIDYEEHHEEVRINSASSASLHQLELNQESEPQEQHHAFDEEDSLQDHSHHHCQQHQHSPNLSPVRKEFEQTNGHGSHGTTNCFENNQAEEIVVNGGGDVIVEDVMTRSFIEDPTNPLSNPFNGSHNTDDQVETENDGVVRQSAPVGYLNDSNDLNRTHELSDDSEPGQHDDEEDHHHVENGDQNGHDHHQNGNGNHHHHNLEDRQDTDLANEDDLETTNYKSTLDVSVSDKLINGIESLKLQVQQEANGIDSRSWNVLELPKPVNPSDSPAPPANKPSSGAKKLATPASPSSPAQKPTAESKTATKPTSQQPSSNVIKAPITPSAYVEVAYIPAHGNSNYVDVEFFKRVRAKHYILSCAEASEQVLNALLDAKEQYWTSGEDKQQVVNLIPTYEWDSLKKWFVNNEDRLAKAHIEIMPAACFAEVTMDSDPTSTCQAYKLEL